MATQGGSSTLAGGCNDEKSSGSHDDKVAFQLNEAESNKIRRSGGRKQEKEAYKLGLARERLIADKNVLMEENVELKKQVIELLQENDDLHRNCRMHFNKNI